MMKLVQHHFSQYQSIKLRSYIGYITTENTKVMKMFILLIFTDAAIRMKNSTMNLTDINSVTDGCLIFSLLQYILFVMNISFSLFFPQLILLSFNTQNI